MIENAKNDSHGKFIKRVVRVSLKFHSNFESVSWFQKDELLCIWLFVIFVSCFFFFSFKSHHVLTSPLSFVHLDSSRCASLVYLRLSARYYISQCKPKRKKYRAHFGFFSFFITQNYTWYRSKYIRSTQVKYAAWTLSGLTFKCSCRMCFNRENRLYFHIYMSKQNYKRKMKKRCQSTSTVIVCVWVSLTLVWLLADQFHCHLVISMNFDESEMFWWWWWNEY